MVSGCPKQAPQPDLTADAGVVDAPTLTPGLILKVQPDDADLIIDGTNYGVVSKLETTNGVLALKSGIYQVAIKRAGYVSWRAEVTINERPETLQVTLLNQR